jgi:quercetin dioxygenase-like cupin family protein
VTPTARAAALLLGALCLAAPTSCAQPGQLGQPLPAAVPAPAAPAPVAAAPAPVAAPRTVEPVSGTLDSRVSIRTPGPAVYSVRTVVLAPGEEIGWQRHPGTTVAVVRNGEVTLRQKGACNPVRYASGQALFVGDAVPHRLANAGTAPVELLVTMLLAPGAAETTDVAPACS